MIPYLPHVFRSNFSRSELHLYEDILFDASKDWYGQQLIDEVNATLMRCRQTAHDFFCVTYPYRRNFLNYVDLNSGWMTTFTTVERLSRYHIELMKSGGA